MRGHRTARILIYTHRWLGIVVEDDAATRLYVTENGGDVVAKTTASGRRWGALGAVMHWLYFAPLRRQASLWSNTIIWISIAGTARSIHAAHGEGDRAGAVPRPLLHERG